MTADFCGADKPGDGPLARTSSSSEWQLSVRYDSSCSARCTSVGVARIECRWWINPISVRGPRPLYLVVAVVVVVALMPQTCVLHSRARPLHKMRLLALAQLACCALAASADRSSTSGCKCVRPAALPDQSFHPLTFCAGAYGSMLAFPGRLGEVKLLGIWRTDPGYPSGNCVLPRASAEPRRLRRPGGWPG